MNTVLWRKRKVVTCKLKTIGCMLKKWLGITVMVEAVEKVLSYVSNGMAKEWRVRKKEEKESKERATRLKDQRKGKEGRGKKKEKGEEAESTRRKDRVNAL